ncbi:MAG TPA: helix-turn-helix domain-containing protein [Vicinamibacterales bacterium]|nr:helix-turn-helix domain-containing protein [Vicinamibacterales bacterium]
MQNRLDERKKRIVNSARRLFNQYGFDGVSIDRIMAGAGLTRGAFYTHFSSKSDLYADVVTCFFNTPGATNQWPGVRLDLEARDASAQIIRAYLSRQHADAVETACPMVALPTDVARSGAVAKRAFENAFRAMVDRLETPRRAHGPVPRAKHHAANRTAALSIAALCIGGMVTARAIEDRGLSDELREACASVALTLQKRARSRTVKRRTRTRPN